MRSVVNVHVQLAVLSVSVLCGSSLLINEQATRTRSDAELFDSEFRSLAATRTRSASEIFESQFRSLVATRTRSESEIFESQFRSLVATRTRSEAEAEIFEAQFRSLVVDSLVTPAPRSKATESADLYLADVLHKMSVPSLPDKRKERHLTSEHSLLRVAQSAPESAPVHGVAVKSLLHVVHGSKDEPVKDVIVGPEPSRTMSRDALEHEYTILSRKQGALRYAMKGLFSVVLWAGLMAMLGIFYHQEKQHPPKMDPEGVNVSLHDRARLDRQRWRFGLFECAEVPALCLFSFFCAPIRWADTMRMAGFMNYFSALALVIGLTVLGYLTLGIGFIALAAVCVHFRQRMRHKFDVRSRMCDSQLTDVLSFIFCPWCSIVQEARQIEEAYLARHTSVRVGGSRLFAGKV